MNLSVNVIHPDLARWLTQGGAVPVRGVKHMLVYGTRGKVYVWPIDERAYER